MKALIFSHDQSIVDQIGMICAMRTPAVSATMVVGALKDIGLHIASDAPMLIIIDAARLKPGDLDDIEHIGAQYPRTTFMMVAQSHSPELLIQAMRAGVREVLDLPVNADRFNLALDRILQKSAPAGNCNGKVAAFISCKGGSGATFIATNLAYALGDITKKKVLLVDFNQQFGDAALYITDKKPTLTLSELFNQIDRLDAGFLESSLISVSPNLGILAASEDLNQVVDIQPDHVDVLLRLARRHYDFIILDVGRKIDAVTVRVLDNADIIYPVMQLSLPYIRDGRRLIDIFRSLGYSRDKIRLIVNRFERGGKLGLPDLGKAISVEVALTVSNNYQAVTDSVNQGVPVLQLARNCNVSKNLTELVTQLAGSKDSGKSIFGRLFSRQAVTAG